jgi:alpha-tubulin suppressor-like RCC1 family protein
LDGELGTGTKENQATPTPVSGTLKFNEITAGDNHTCALTVEGDAYCWGWNAFYQRGNPAVQDDASPVPVMTDVRFRSISAGAFHTCAIGIADSLAYCWGYNRQGQAGNGATTTVITPEKVAGVIKFKQITAGGNHTCALTYADAVYCWGSNEFGELGTGSAALNSTTPDLVRGLAFKQIDAGTTHTCGLAASARFYCWGSNEHGELGTGGIFKAGLPGASTPVAVSNQFSVGSAIFAGNQFTCAQDAGVARCWGRDDYGQLGNGSQLDQYQPQQLILPGSRGFSITTFALSGSMHACALVDNAIFCWGGGSAGQLGATGTNFSSLPIRASD